MGELELHTLPRWDLVDMISSDLKSVMCRGEKTSRDALKQMQESGSQDLDLESCPLLQMVHQILIDQDKTQIQRSPEGTKFSLLLQRTPTCHPTGQQNKF